VDANWRRAIAALSRRHDREFAALAYVVLDSREAAERSAAEGIADVLRHSPGEISDLSEARNAMVGATLRRALEAHRTLREVDPLPGMAPDTLLARLTPVQRAVAAGHLSAGVTLKVLADELGQPVGRLASALSAAARVAGGEAVLAIRLKEHAAGVALSVSPEAIEQSLATPPVRPPPNWWRLPAIAAATMGVLAIAIGFRIASLPAGDPATAAASVAPASWALATGAGPALAIEDLTLRDCKIEPASTKLSFRGWLPLQDLVSSSDPNPAAQPVFALVTRTTAEWVGWQTGQGRPMFPRPVGRLGCALDPATAKATVYAIPESWEPPAMMDGCPASPIALFGGNREIGGPHAFTLLPFQRQGWWSHDPTLEINVRIAPSPATESEITALAWPLGPGDPVRFEVRGPPISEDQPPSSSYFVTLSQATIPSEGCWLFAIAVDGQVVGSAVLPMTARS
jgi:hypothetical protein